MSEFVVTGSADSDSDGLPDDFELSNNLNPSDPSDAREDPDRDGLNNLDEFRQGTNLRNPDTDGDGLRDGEEIVRGTNPLLADTDGDLIPDGLEIQLGTNPLDPRSGSLAQALSRLEVTPIAPTLVVNTLSPEASAQLRVTGVLLDNSRVDLTSTVRGTRYSSSNLTICNFGATPGQVFAGQAGSCVVTVTNSSFTAEVPVRVENFNPTVRSQLILGGAVALDLFQSYVVAVGGSTLRMVNVSNRSNPAVAGTVTAPGANFLDVRVSGSLAYAAGGAGGLYIFNIANPGTPQLVRTIDTPGSAEDIAVVPNQRLYLADGANGLLIYDLSGDPTNPQLRSTTSVGSPVHGVAVDAQRNLAVLALQANGLRVVDVSNPNAPVLRGALAGGDVRDVEIRGNAALLADLSFRSFTSVDISNPSAPVLSRSLPAQFGGLLFDIGLAGDFAFGADVFFVNDTPVIDITDPLNPVARFIFRFPGDATGTGVKADAAFVYLLSDGNLSIGQYRAITDNNGIPPTVSIVNPMPGSTVIARTTVPVTIQAVDDVAVAAVQLLVNGQVVGTATGAPYTIGLPVPAGVTSIAFQARAVDLGGNVGVSPEAGYNVIVGPLTTVTGSGVDRQNNPVVNARVNVINEFFSQSGADGRYAISNVPAALQRVRAYGEVAVNNVVLRGRSGWANTVPNGATDVGQMIYFPDADWDGLPDDWEEQFACVNRSSPDDEADPDGDGLSNFEEYGLQTNPCIPNLAPGRTHLVSQIYSLRNGPAPVALPQGRNEIVSAVVSLRNGEAPTFSIPAGRNEAVSNLISLRNGSDPGVLLPNGRNEAVSQFYSLRNTGGPAVLPPGLNEAVSFLISVRNGPDAPGILPAGRNETVSFLYSLANGAPLNPLNAPVPSMSAEVTGPGALNDAVASSDDTEAPAHLRLALSHRELPADGTLTVRATLEGAARRAALVRFQIDGVATEERTQPPYEFALAAPHGVPLFAVTAIALDEQGRTLAVAEERVRTQPSEAADLDLRLVDRDGKPLRSQAVAVWANGLLAEYFDFQRPLVAIPNLDGEKPAATRYVASLDRRNPESIFGQDPWGLGMFPDYATRFSGWLQVPQAGAYRFVLRSQEGARLRIGDQEVLAVPGGASRSRSAEGVVTLPEGMLRLTLEHYETVASPELILEWAPPGQVLSPLPRQALWTPVARQAQFHTDNTGRLRLPGIPSHLGALSLWPAASGWLGTVDPLTAARGQRVELKTNPNPAFDELRREPKDFDKENR